MVERKKFISDYDPYFSISIEDGPDRVDITRALLGVYPLKFRFVQIDTAADPEDEGYETELGWRDFILDRQVERPVFGPDSVTLEGILVPGLLCSHYWDADHQRDVTGVQINYYPDFHAGGVEVDIGD